MARIPTTSTTLLRDMANDVQHERWGEFVTRYRPMMEAFMRERFPSLEADDIIQETLIALCKVLPSYHYAPDEKGHFHNFLTGILRNKARAALRKEQHQSQFLAEAGWSQFTATEAGGSRLSRPEWEGRAAARPDPDDDPSYREALFEIALRQFLADGSVADRTKRIFERTAINGESPESVAAAFKMTRHAVDQAKSRALARLREIVKKLEALANE